MPVRRLSEGRGAKHPQPGFSRYGHGLPPSGGGMNSCCVGAGSAKGRDYQMATTLNTRGGRITYYHVRK